MQQPVSHPVRVGHALFHDHLAPCWGGRYGDVFVLRPIPGDFPPPWDWVAGAVRPAARALAALRPGACLWIRVPAARSWWTRALRDGLHPLPVPVAVSEREPAPEAFSFAPPLHAAPISTASWNDIVLPTLGPRRVLTALARLGEGYVAEVASLARLAPGHARKVLHRLRAARQVVHDHDGRYPVWRITRRGLSLVLRLWAVPKGHTFTARRRERSGSSGARHRRVSRLWNAWLKQAGYRVFGGWSEVRIPGQGRYSPDALAWGPAWDGPKGEVVYWLEVESGHRSREHIARAVDAKLTAARQFGRRYRVRVVFALLAMPWVLKAAAPAVRDLDDRVAVVFGDWNAFGRLPRPVWGRLR